MRLRYQRSESWGAAQLVFSLSLVARETPTRTKIPPANCLICLRKQFRTFSAKSTALEKIGPAGDCEGLKSLSSTEVLAFPTGARHRRHSLGM
jgi:hypothetical protein